MKNIIEILLDQLEVKYTHAYITKLYNEHPHKYNMYGLFDILHLYNINAVGITVKDKDYAKLSFPCILHINNGFVVVTKLYDKIITYYWNGRQLSLPIESFNMMWTGNAIVIDGDSDASEPNYIDHLHEKRLRKRNKLLFVLAFATLIVIKILEMNNNYDYYTLLFMALDILGIIPCCLLLEKQMHSRNGLGEKICSLFHQKDCDQVIFSEKAKILGGNWSEIGMSFFIANFLSLIFIPSCINELSVIDMLAIIFSTWSIYYQWMVIKQWCILCLLVQVVILLMACCGLSAVISNGFHYNIIIGIQFCCLWFLLTIMLNIFVSYKYFKGTRFEDKQKYKALKSNKKVFQVLLTSEEYHDTTFHDSTISFGNKNANVRITVLSNPHCIPCAKFHIKIDELLEKNKDKVCVQYILTSFTEELKDSCRFLIAAYQQFGEHQATLIFSQWYRERPNTVHEYIDKWKVNIHSKSVEEEMMKHEEWRKETGYNATPTILVNGYELPIEYDVDDISYILD